MRGIKMAGIPPACDKCVAFAVTKGVVFRVIFPIKLCISSVLTFNEPFPIEAFLHISKTHCDGLWYPTLGLVDVEFHIPKEFLNDVELVNGPGQRLEIVRCILWVVTISCGKFKHLLNRNEIEESDTRGFDFRR